MPCAAIDVWVWLPMKSTNCGFTAVMASRRMNRMGEFQFLFPFAGE